MASITKSGNHVKERFSAKGFTLIEMIAALAIMITIVAIAVPMAIKFMEVQETKAARTEMSHIFNDIFFGDPKNGTFGFVGDIGHYPEKSLKELIKNPGYPSIHTCTGGIKYGWNGPYSPDGSNLLKDPWGEDYLYKWDPYNAAIIISKGPNKNYDSGGNDDLIYPIDGAEIPVYGSVLVEVQDKRLTHVPATQTLLLHYSDGGTERALKGECTCDASNNYTCSYLFETDQHLKKYVHHGLHLIELYDNRGHLMTSTIATVIHRQQTKVTIVLR